MKTSDFNYELPEELIAQHPMNNRDESRLLILNKSNGMVTHQHFYDILEELHAGDVLVLNNTKVIPARLYGTKIGGKAQVEVLLLKRLDGFEDEWEVLVRPGKRLKKGASIDFGNGLLTGHIIEEIPQGRRIRFEYDGVFEELLERLGTMPLPPYIHEKLSDQNRYQTVYAEVDGSAAAPTAGLHFTPELLDKIKAKGVIITTVLLHVGLGTFRPVKVEQIENHNMHEEYYEVNQEAADIINAAKDEGRRVIAVGTTTTRTLESVAKNGKICAGSGITNIFIYPGYQFQIVDALITNFHLPQSTLLMLVSALASKDTILSAYREAVNKKYRFFSFGDAMFIR